MRDNLQSKAWYALRRTLPLWSFEDNLRELIELCPRYRIDEVIVKVDTEEFSHGFPSFEWVKNYQSCLFQIKKELDKIGVVFSINPWITLGHADRGRDCTKVFPEMGFMTGHDGTTCKDCACPLSAGWRSHTVRLWQLYAQTEPAVLWVEDDIRTFNHSPVKFGCFCDAHLLRFSEKVGRKVSRKELVEAILSPGEPHPYRKMWFNLQSEITIETAKLLEKTVHEISPRTRLGLMSSDPESHSLEGRDWHALAQALARPYKPISRPCMGHYTEDSLQGLYISGHFLRTTQYCLPDETVVQTEIENYPFTQYSKSNRVTFLQMAFSFASGSQGVTLNLFDHCGTPMKSDPSIGMMLRESKDFLNGIGQKCLPGGIPSGIRILHHPGASDYMVLGDKATYADLRQDGYKWQSILEPLGFAATSGKSDIVALSGQTIRAFSEKEIKEFLARSVLIDLSAMKILIEKGCEEFLGVSIKQEFPVHEKEPLSAEEFFDESFGGRRHTYLTLARGNPTIAEIVLQPQARMVSHIVDPDGRYKYPFLTVFENSLGGRVALYPVDINQIVNPSFLNHHRQMQLYNVLKWLSRDKLPLFVEGGVYPLAFRSNYEERTIIGVFNLSLDKWPHVKVRLHAGNKEVASIDILSSAGKWGTGNDIEIRRDKESIELKINEPLSFELPMIISVEWKKG